MRVLVLDDDEDMRWPAFKKWLADHDVTFVATAKKAIEQLTAHEWNYVFLDHDLGGGLYCESGPGTGYEVAEWLHAHPDRHPHTWIVIHSFNPAGAQAMHTILPDSVIAPGVWLKNADKELDDGRRE